MATLDCSNPAPRVNFQQLGQFVGKRVTLVGRIEGVDGNTLQLRTPHNGVIAVQLQNVAPQVRRRAGGAPRCDHAFACLLRLAAASAESITVRIRMQAASHFLLHCLFGTATALLPPMPQASLLEVQGLVNSPTSVTEDSLTQLSENFGELRVGAAGSWAAIIVTIRQQCHLFAAA